MTHLKLLPASSGVGTACLLNGEIKRTKTGALLHTSYQPHLQLPPLQEIPSPWELPLLLTGNDQGQVRLPLSTCLCTCWLSLLQTRVPNVTAPAGSVEVPQVASGSTKRSRPNDCYKYYFAEFIKCSHQVKLKEQPQLLSSSCCSLVLQQPLHRILSGVGFQLTD